VEGLDGPRVGFMVRPFLSPDCAPTGPSQREAKIAISKSSLLLGKVAANPPPESPDTEFTVPARGEARRSDEGRATPPRLAALYSLNRPFCFEFHLTWINPLPEGVVLLFCGSFSRPCWVRMSLRTHSVPFFLRPPCPTF